MLQLFKTMLDSLSGSAASQPETLPEGISAQQFASVSLMMMLADADFSVDERETALTELYLTKELGLSSAAARHVCQQAQQRSKEAISLHEFTKQLKQLSYEARLELLEALWQQAYADNELDPNEEAMLRKIADLLFIRHSDFIRAKLAVISA